MKKFRQLLANTAELQHRNYDEFKQKLWELMFYSPKFPVRHQQKALMDQAQEFNVKVNDLHFSGKELQVKGYKWGKGDRKILITHGWGSKAADLGDLILSLEAGGFEVIAFDAPGNGASEGELTNLLLYVNSVLAITKQEGTPDILIGHSLGAMANVMALQKWVGNPPALISLAPMIILDAYFSSVLKTIHASNTSAHGFYQSFEKNFKVQVDVFEFSKLYKPEKVRKHLLAYDINDKITPGVYTQEFLELHPDILQQQFKDVGHERMIKDPGVISLILAFLNSAVPVSELPALQLQNRGQ